MKLRLNIWRATWKKFKRFSIYYFKLLLEIIHFVWNFLFSFIDKHKKIHFSLVSYSFGKTKRLSFAFFIAVYKISFWKRDLWFKHFIGLWWVRHCIVNIIIGSYTFSFIKWNNVKNVQFGTEKIYRFSILCTLCLRYKSFISIKLETKYLKSNVGRDTQTFQDVLCLLF